MNMKTFGQRHDVGVIDVGIVEGKSATQCWSYRCGDGLGKRHERVN